MNANTVNGHKTKHDSRSLGKAIATSLLVTLFLMLLLLLVLATVAYNSEDPSAFVAPASYAVTLFSAFFCGFAAARLRGKQGLFCGLLSGLAFLCVFLIGMFAFAGDSEMNMASLLLFYPIMYLLSVLGGVFGGMKRVRTRKTHRRRR